jgi:hypothetical protein
MRTVPIELVTRAGAPLALACTMFAGAPLAAQEREPVALPQVTITAVANRDPVEKSYRKMIRGMDLFEQRHALARAASLRFKLLPRRHGTDMSRVQIDVVGSTVDIEVPVAPDQTFTLARNPQALAENAMVTPNRATGSLTWRTEIRTPGLPAGARRLGDLRLECEVGMEAGLVSNNSNFIGQLLTLVSDTPDYCRRKEQRYLFFAERPLFSVSLQAGQRRETLAIDRLYASASDDSSLMADLPYCDCEVLLDRSYYMPLGDTSWPDDTLVEFEYMDEAPR